LFITATVDVVLALDDYVEHNRTEFNLIVPIGKSEEKVTL